MDKLIDIILNMPIDSITDEMLKSIIQRHVQYKDTIRRQLNMLMHKDPTKYNDIIKDIQSATDKNVIGDVVEIDANPETYKNLLTVAKDEKWIYNGITIVEKNDKWVIFFY